MESRDLSVCRGSLQISIPSMMIFPANKQTHAHISKLISHNIHKQMTQHQPQLFTQILFRTWRIWFIRFNKILWLNHFIAVQVSGRSQCWRSLWHYRTTLEEELPLIHLSGVFLIHQTSLQTEHEASFRGSTTAYKVSEVRHSSLMPCGEGIHRRAKYFNNAALAVELLAWGLPAITRSTKDILLITYCSFICYFLSLNYPLKFVPKS